MEKFLEILRRLMKLKRKFNKRVEYLPICLRISGQDCLVIGGGNVALRKIRTLLEFKATVTCLSPVVTKNLEILIKGEKIEFIKGVYSKKVSLKKFRLVVAATDDVKVNGDIVTRGIKEGVLVNCATGGKNNEVIFPAIVKKRGAVIAVSTNANNPSKAKNIKEKIRKII